MNGVGGLLDLSELATEFPSYEEQDIVGTVPDINFLTVMVSYDIPFSIINTLQRPKSTILSLSCVTMK